MSSDQGGTPAEFGKGDPQENFERMTGLARGPKGEQGARGERGLSHLQGRAVVVLFLIAAGCGVGNLFWTAHEVRASATAQQRQAAAEQAAQRAQGAVLEKQLCSTLNRLAALKPPAGNAARNPARGYDQQLHAVLSGLSPDLGCKK